MSREIINDARLTPTMNRIRSGKTQIFTEGIGGTRIELWHDKREMYAELVDRKWYWVSGCAECNGKPRDWSTYIECEQHDRCRVCGINRKDTTGYVWGGRNGWICRPCEQDEGAKIRRKAFKKLQGKQPDCTYTDKIVCAHCGSNIPSEDLHESQDIDCGVCGGEMHLTVDYTPIYSTEVKGGRITC